MFYTEEHYLYFKLFIEEFYSEITGINNTDPNSASLATYSKSLRWHRSEVWTLFFKLCFLFKFCALIRYYVSRFLLWNIVAKVIIISFMYTVRLKFVRNWNEILSVISEKRDLNFCCQSSWNYKAFHFQLLRNKKVTFRSNYTNLYLLTNILFAIVILVLKHQTLLSP